MGVIIHEIASACIRYKIKKEVSLLPYSQKEHIMINSINKFLKNLKKYQNDNRENGIFNKPKRGENEVSRTDRKEGFDKRKTWQSNSRGKKGTKTYKQRNKLDD